MKIRSVQKTDAMAVADFLHKEMDSAYPVEKWMNLFDYHWTQPPHHGYLAEDNGQILGFLGCVFSPAQETIAKPICNLSSWCVAKSMRGSGVGASLFTGFLNENQWHQTMLTAASYLVPIYQNFGYQPYETHRYVFQPQRSPGQVKGWLDTQIPTESLDPSVQKIYLDHKIHRCRSLYLEEKNEHCFLLFKDTPRKHGSGTFSELLYCSDFDFLTKHSNAIAHFGIRDSNSILAVDRRYFLEKPFGGKEEPLYSPRLAKTTDPQPPFFHAYYSEVVLLDLKM